MSQGIEIIAPRTPEMDAILTVEALQFLEKLHHRFDARRQELVAARQEVQAQIDAGNFPTYPKETRTSVRESEWSVGPAPADLDDRRCEITGPVDRKMMINALNSGAKVFMADFEDANSPTWANAIGGQINCYDAARGTIAFVDEAKGKEYKLAKSGLATLVVRPRGWHLYERHISVDGHPMSGSLVDFGLYFFHNAKALLERGSGPYFYLPKLEHYLEARLWNDVFKFAQDELAIPQGTIRATVLIETITAAFHMEEILFELKEHSAGLNAGRWDYIFSCIKRFRSKSDILFPDRIQVTMTVPFMRAYTERLVHVCHKRGAHAIGGMAAFIPNRRDPEVTEQALAKVREDKRREAEDGFDGSWVAHPDLVPICKEEFSAQMGDKPNQKSKLREDVSISESQLIDFTIADGKITEAGLRTNILVALEYLDSWFRGIGAAALHNLMEDAATAEISRAQVWHWMDKQATLDDGRTITEELCRTILQEELEKLGGRDQGELYKAEQILTRLLFQNEFAEFLTLPAYEILD